MANNLLVNSNPIVFRLWNGIGLCVNWDPGALFEPAVLLFVNKLLFKLLIEFPNSEDVDDDSLTSLHPF